MKRLILITTATTLAEATNPGIAITTYGTRGSFQAGSGFTIGGTPQTISAIRFQTLGTGYLEYIKLKMSSKYLSAVAPNKLATYYPMNSPKYQHPALYSTYLRHY